MDSVQFHVILNHLQATAVLIAAAIAALGRLQKSTQDKHLTLVARGHTPEYPSRATSQRRAGGPLRRKQPRAAV
ncbi:MAG: hypothetical protein ACHQ7N_13650 [Candidatus Methylomirabilales bacterium]